MLQQINNNTILALLFLSKFYSGVCHQHEIKLLEVFGIESMVCSRCAGIYAGVLLTSFLLLFITVEENLGIKLLLLSSIPLILDVVFYNLGLYNYSKTTAFSTGIFFGSAGFYYFYIGLEKLFSEQKLQERI